MMHGLTNLKISRICLLMVHVMILSQFTQCRTFRMKSKNCRMLLYEYESLLVKNAMSTYARLSTVTSLGEF